MKQEYKEQSERLGVATAVERSLPAGSVPRGQSPMELLTPRELSLTTEVQTPAAPIRVTISDPSDTLGDPLVEGTLRQLVVTTGRLVADRKVPGSGVTAPYQKIDDSGRLELSLEVMKKTGAAAATKPAKTSKASGSKMREMPLKKVSRVFDIQKDSQIKKRFTRVPYTDMPACFNQSTWSPAINMYQPPLGTSL